MFFYSTDLIQRGDLLVEERVLHGEGRLDSILKRMVMTVKYQPPEAIGSLDEAYLSCPLYIIKSPRRWRAWDTDENERQGERERHGRGGVLGIGIRDSQTDICTHCSGHAFMIVAKPNFFTQASIHSSTEGLCCAVLLFLAFEAMFYMGSRWSLESRCRSASQTLSSGSLR